MNKQVGKLLKEAGVWREFVVMMILRSPFDICNSILTANMMQKFMRLIEQNQSENLGKTLGVFFALTVLLFGYNMTIWSTIAVRFTVKLQKTLREKMFHKIMSLPASELMGSSKAEWFTRLNNDIDKAVGYLVNPINFMHMVIASVNLVISSVIMMFLSVELYIIGICCLVPFFMLNVFVISSKINVFKKEAQKSLVGYTDWIDAALKEKEMLAVYDAKDFAGKRIAQKSTGILKQNMKAHNRGAICNMFYAFSGMLGYLLLLYRGNGIIEKKLDDFADLCKVTQYRGMLVLSFNCVLNSIINMRGSLVGVERVNEVLLGEKTMDEQLLKIGELAGLCNVSPKALRVYEKRGLIKPIKIDEESGYRYYSADQVKDVETLIEWRDMGFSLKEIRIIFSGKYNKEDIDLILSAKKREWQEKIWIAEAKMEEIDKLGCNLKFDEKTNLSSLSDKDRAWYLSRLTIINDNNVRQAISEAIWL